MVQLVDPGASAVKAAAAAMLAPATAAAAAASDTDFDLSWLEDSVRAFVCRHVPSMISMLLSLVIVAVVARPVQLGGTFVDLVLVVATCSRLVGTRCSSAVSVDVPRRSAACKDNHGAAVAMPAAVVVGVAAAAPVPPSVQLRLWPRQELTGAWCSTSSRSGGR